MESELAALQQYEEEFVAALTLQSVCRGYRARQALAWQHGAAATVQALQRGRTARAMCALELRAVIRVQALVRALSHRVHFTSIAFVMVSPRALTREL